MGVVDGIASGATEQSAALKQLNGTVSQMDNATQQNAAMAEQASAASHSLTQEAENLAVLISRFRLAESEMAPRPVQSRTMPARASAAPAPSRPSDREHPARAIVSKVQGAFRARTEGNAAIKDEWEEF